MSEKCKERLYDNWGRSHGCSRNAKKDGYCMTHHPDAVLEKKKKRDAVAAEKWKKHPAIKLQVIERQRDELVQAAQAIIDRWDSPKWSNLPHTGEYIAKLRDAVAKAKE